MKNIPMSAPDLTEIEHSAVQGVLGTHSLSIGPQLKAFEESVATVTSSKYGIGVNSGTSGLHLCIIAAGVKDNDLVITTPYSFIASANCIVYERGIPVFVDVEEKTGNIDPTLLAESAHDFQLGGTRAHKWLPPAMRSNGLNNQLKAILPVHAFGQPVNMAPVMRIAIHHDLVVIEDACESIGAEYNQRRTGSLGNASVFAFYPNKQITTGEGGMIVTDNEEWAELFRSLRNQGRDVFDAWLKHTRLGYNYRLDEMSAALGLAQIKRLDELLTKRAKVAGWYDERLAAIELIERPTIVPTTTRMSWFVYVIRIKPPAKRNSIMTHLKEVGIPSRPYFVPIHLQPFYQNTFGYKKGDFPVTEYLGEVSLALPFSSVMSEDQVDQVCSALKKVLNQSIQGSSKEERL